MVRNIVQYPAPLSVEYATDVRAFDEELFALIEDLKDTITENNLEGLSAYQIGNSYNVVVVKDEKGLFLEMINPRLINHSGRVTTQETTTYYPNHSAEIIRFENISVVYQNRDGKDCSLKASGNFAILIQRKIDYTFGATFIHKMSKKARVNFEKRVANGVVAGDVGYADYCPTTFKRDKLVLVMNIVMALMAITFVVALFIEKMTLLSMIWNYLVYGSIFVIALDIIYFFYAQYEGKKLSGCSSCQIGNIIGTALIILFKLTLIMLFSYFFIYK
jgi:peptide deformylase